MTHRRPMIAREVFARKHVTDGRATVILHDSRRFRTLEVGLRGWAVLSRMDGTRDLEGIAAAMSHRVSVEDIGRFIDELEAAGVLADAATGERSDMSSEPAALGRAPKPVEQLRGFRLRCDGRGSCCRFYPSVVFSPAESARARAWMPEVLDGANDEANVFLPERGLARESLAVALVDGRCAYLLPDGRCGIHAAGGARAKPYGCSLYPVSLVDDGERVRASAVLECACVIESGIVPISGGEPLLEDAVATTAGLDPRLVIDELPAEIALTESKRAARAEVAAWADEAAAHEPPNVAAYLAGLAATIERTGLGDAPESESFDPTELGPRVERVRERAARRASEEFRSGADLARQVFSLIEVAAAMALADLSVWGGPSRATHPTELFYLRVQLFGRQLLPRSGEDTLVSALRDRAARILVGRAMYVAARMAELTDPALRHPLAMLEAASRAYGLG